MLKLTRRPVNDFLGADHRQALVHRIASAQQLAGEVDTTTTDKSKRIGERWDAFRAGRTAKGTFPALWCELLAMAFNKCVFCETPAPDTVEHMEEKSAHVAKTFDWDNLLPACSQCNRTRENSGSTVRPLDPSKSEPLNFFGWDEYGNFAPNPAHGEYVLEHVRMYGLSRFREERRNRVLVLRVLLAAVVMDEPLRTDTRDALELLLSASSAWLGPVREYLLRPPTDEEALLLDGALHRLPEIRRWVEPWLRPPPWVSVRWR